MLVQIERAGTRVEVDGAESARAHFDRHRWLKVPNLNTGPGDAALFRIDPALQHRATAVTRGTKTAFAGWFRSEAPLRAALAQDAA